MLRNLYNASIILLILVISSTASAQIWGGNGGADDSADSEASSRARRGPQWVSGDGYSRAKVAGRSHINTYEMTQDVVHAYAPLRAEAWQVVELDSDVWGSELTSVSVEYSPEAAGTEVMVTVFYSVPEVWHPGPLPITDLEYDIAASVVGTDGIVTIDIPAGREVAANASLGIEVRVLEFATGTTQGVAYVVGDVFGNGFAQIDDLRSEYLELDLAFSLTFQEEILHPVVITDQGQVGIGTTQPPATLDVQGESIRIAKSFTPIGNAECAIGEIAWDEDHIWVCVRADEWRSAVLE